MKKFLRFVMLAAIVVAVVWATRDRMLPKPQAPDHHPPPFRHPPSPAADRAPAEDSPAVASTPAAAPAESDGSDDLQRVKGIGPVYAGKLGELGITTFSALIGADSSSVAEHLEVSVESVVDWKTQATELIG
jgi:predicted flap endonuclease-1-like 5' DNA nuclease